MYGCAKYHRLKKFLKISVEIETVNYKEWKKESKRCDCICYYVLIV